MLKTKGYTLLEVIIAGTATIVIITSMLGFFFQTHSAWKTAARSARELEETFFVLDNIRENVYGGSIQESSDQDTLIIKDPQGKQISFYLKNKRICMYKNSTAYLTTTEVPCQKLNFDYSAPDKLRSLDLTFSSGKLFTFYL